MWSILFQCRGQTGTNSKIIGQHFIESRNCEQLVVRHLMRHGALVHINYPLNSLGANPTLKKSCDHSRTTTSQLRVEVTTSSHAWTIIRNKNWLSPFLRASTHWSSRSLYRLEKCSVTSHLRVVGMLVSPWKYKHEFQLNYENNA